jgi:hypothetical protein
MMNFISNLNPIVLVCGIVFLMTLAAFAVMTVAAWVVGKADSHMDDGDNRTS